MAAAFESLADWVRQNGGHVHPSLGLAPTPSNGFTLAVKADAPAVEAHEMLFRLPYSLTLSYLNAVAAGNDDSGYQPRCKPLPREFLDATADHDAVAYVFLMQQYLLGDKSFWYPYVSLLPQPGSPSRGSIPLLWEDADLEWLRGTYLESVASQQRDDLKTRWDKTAHSLREAGWLSAEYTFELFCWARFVFISRQFPSIALHGDVEAFKPEYRALVEVGVSLDDGPQILYPLLDHGNHAQQEQPEYGFEGAALTLAKTVRLEPGDELCYAYDKDDQMFNNTTLLRDFGFVLANNKAVEATFPAPFDTKEARHPGHVVFSTPSTIEEFYASANEMHQMIVTVRSPSKDARGPINPEHAVPALRHFHPLLASMVAFREANLLERVALRKDPHALPSERLKEAVVGLLRRHLQGVLQRMADVDEVLKLPKSEPQRRAKSYRSGQMEILKEVAQLLET